MTKNLITQGQSVVNRFTNVIINTYIAINKNVLNFNSIFLKTFIFALLVYPCVRQLKNKIIGNKFLASRCVGYNPQIRLYSKFTGFIAYCDKGVLLRIWKNPV